MPSNIEIDELIPADTVAEELGIKVGTLQAWRVLGKGPCFIKVGRRVLYRRSDLGAWLATLHRQPVTAKDRRVEAAA